MTRTVLIAAVLAVAVAGAGLILAAGGQSAATAITDPGSAPITQRWRLDSTYLAEAHTHGIDRPEGELLATARDVCHSLDTGATIDQLVYDTEQRYAIPAPDAGYLVAAAVRARCPEHASEVER